MASGPSSSASCSEIRACSKLGPGTNIPNTLLDLIQAIGSGPATTLEQSLELRGRRTEHQRCRGSRLEVDRHPSRGCWSPGQAHRACAYACRPNRRRMSRSAPPPTTSGQSCATERSDGIYSAATRWPIDLCICPLCQFCPQFDERSAAELDASSSRGRRA